MQILYKELTSPITEIDGDGKKSIRPPTAIMLKAARALQEMDSINQNNNQNIQAMQKHAAAEMENHIRMNRQIQEMTTEIEKLKAYQKRLHGELLDKDAKIGAAPAVPQEEEAPQEGLGSN